MVLVSEASFSYSLLSTLHTLDTAHKSLQMDSGLRELAQVRHKILQLLTHRHKHFKQLCARSFMYGAIYLVNC